MVERRWMRLQIEPCLTGDARTNHDFPVTYRFRPGFPMRTMLVRAQAGLKLLLPARVCLIFWGAFSPETVEGKTV